jgi:hypothetical protein
LRLQMIWAGSRARTVILKALKPISSIYHSLIDWMLVHLVLGANTPKGKATLSRKHTHHSQRPVSNRDRDIKSDLARKLRSWPSVDNLVASRPDFTRYPETPRWRQFVHENRQNRPQRIRRRRRVRKAPSESDQCKALQDCSLLDMCKQSV